MKSSLGFSVKSSAVLLLLVSACSSDGAVQVIPGGAGGSPGKGGSGGTPGTAGSTTAGSAGSSASGSGGLPSAGAAGSSAGAATAGVAGAAAGSGNIAGGAGTGTGGDSGGGGSTSGSGGEATAGGGSGGSGGAVGNPCVAMAGNAQTFEGHCYELITEPTSWRDAEATCEARGGYLVTISSEGELTQADFDAENAFVWNLSGQMDTWIGATDGLMDNEGGNGTPSTWSNGEMMVLSDWEGGEPSNTQKDCPSGAGMCWEHCGFMWQERGGGWNDDVCAAEKRYVCEWEETQ